MFSTALYATRIVFSRNKYRITAVITFALALVLYLVTLPVMFTGGKIGFLELRHLTAESLSAAIVMAALLALIIPFSVYLFAQGLKPRSGLAAGGIAVGLLGPLLCCSPMIPVFLGLLAAVFPFIGGVHAGLIQGFVATHETWFFLLAIALLTFALSQNARRIARGCACKPGGKANAATGCLPGPTARDG